MHEVGELQVPIITPKEATRNSEEGVRIFGRVDSARPRILDTDASLAVLQPRSKGLDLVKQRARLIERQEMTSVFNGCGCCCS